MPSIFDPPAGARTFKASDWLAASLAPARSAGVDVQLQAPPSAPADDEPITADSPPYRVPPAEAEPLPTWATEPTTQPAASHRRANWPYALLAWLLIGGGVAMIVGLYGPTWLALLALAIMTVELLLWALVALEYGRL